MQRVQAAALRWSLRLADAVGIVVSFLLVAWLREVLGDRWALDLVPGNVPVLQVVTLQNQLPLLLLVLPIWMLALHGGGAYTDLRRLRRDVLFIRLSRAVVVAVLAVLAVQFVVPPPTPTSRTFLFGFAAASVVILFGVRIWLGQSRLGGQGSYDILVLGSAAEAVPFLAVLARHRDWGLRIEGVLRPDDDTLSPTNDVPVLGIVSDLPQVLAQRNIAQVFLTGRTWSVETLRFVADTCEEVGVTFSMDANFLGL